jgi:hypothetical protein
VILTTKEGTPKQPVKHPEYLPGQLLVRVNPDFIQVTKVEGAAAPRRAPESLAGPFGYLQRNVGMKRIAPLFRGLEAPRLRTIGFTQTDPARILKGALAQPEGLEGLALVHLDMKSDPVRVARHLTESQAISFAEPVPARWLAMPRPGALPHAVPARWNLTAIDWYKATRPSAARVDVAVLDSGVDDGHPALAGAVAAYDATGRSRTDIVGHGTHVCGIIAARAKKTIPITGIANCRLHVWKILSDQATDGVYYVDVERYLQVLQALEETTIRIVNLSLGGTATSQSETLVFRRLIEREVTIVAAMGNERHEGNPTEYPAAYQGVIAVGAVDERLRPAAYSNRGAHLAVYAPGSNVLSSCPRAATQRGRNQAYDDRSGTSMAVPHVTAAVALLRAKNPAMTAASLRGALMKRTSTLGSQRAGKARSVGLLNIPK